MAPIASSARGKWGELKQTIVDFKKKQIKVKSRRVAVALLIPTL